MAFIDDPTDENDASDPNAPAGPSPDDEGIGNIRPTRAPTDAFPGDPNAPAAPSPNDEGIGNIRPKPQGEEPTERFPGEEGDLGPRT
jgi:hypothetical protein